jgi:hypothetical protein
MRFVTPPQTISEYRHQKMPVYETLMTVGTAAATGVAGAAASYGLSKLGGGGSMGSFPSYGEIANQALGFSKKFTKKNIELQNLVTPGSSDQREHALQLINQYMSGQVPLDVQQNTQRAIAQSLGGGYNPFTHGGLAPNAFARNIGQTSLGLSQYGLSAAPTWQQLANQMVTKPSELLSSAMGVAQDQYQAQANQYAAQQAQNQYQQNMAMQGFKTGVGLYSAGNQANYLGNLSGYANTSSSPYGGSFLSSLFSSGGSNAAGASSYLNDYYMGSALM